MMQNKGLRCMAKGRDGEWWAICVDLDIAVDGESFQEVKDRLDAAIEQYVESVLELPEQDQARLLSRRAPRYLRAQFVLLSWLTKLRGGNDGQHRQFTFSSHAHA